MDTKARRTRRVTSPEAGGEAPDVTDGRRISPMDRRFGHREGLRDAVRDGGGMAPRPIIIHARIYKHEY